MDDGKSGVAKTGRKAPRPVEHNAKGGAQNPFGKPKPKLDPLKRMKAVAGRKA